MEAEDIDKWLNDGEDAQRASETLVCKLNLRRKDKDKAIPAITEAIREAEQEATERAAKIAETFDYAEIAAFGPGRIRHAIAAAIRERGGRDGAK